MNNDLMNVTIPIKYDTCETDELIANILELNQKWGIRRLLMFGPNKYIRITGWPEAKVFEDIGHKLKKVIDATAPHGIEVGWWCTTTMKTGKADFQRIVGLNGVSPEISSCPLDTNFAKQLSERIATVARIARPYMILLEDDFELSNHPGVDQGCFCPLHLKAFAKQTGKDYTREELQQLLDPSNPQSIKLQQQWGQLSNTSLTDLSTQIRQAVDKVSPETRITLCQPGCADQDGDMTLSVSQALAGPNTRPYVRLAGTSYSSNDSGQSLPSEMFHALYSTQHLPEHFELVHETDTYPHTRYFASSARVESQLHNACAYGMTGTLLHCMQYLDDPFEDTGYLDKLVANLPRLNKLIEEVAVCELDGCEVVFRPNGGRGWEGVLGRYGMPITTKGGRVKFISGNTVNQLSNDEIEKLLAGPLFADGKAAYLIAQRGYADCLGVDVAQGGKVTFYTEHVRQDAGFVGLTSKQHYNMLFAAAGGEKYDYFQLTARPGTQTLTEFMSPAKQPVQPGLTRCANRLGGRVAVMAGSLDANNSSSIFSYRKKEIIRQIIQWLNEEMIPASVLKAPNVHMTMNRHRNNEHIILTINNLCADTQDQMPIRCDHPWANGQVQELNQQGTWEPLAVNWQDHDLALPSPFNVMRTRVFKIFAAK